MVLIDPQTESPFFRLPAEIREKIQRLSITPADQDLLKMGITTCPEILFRTYEESLPSVMCTCKKMYTDMSPFAFTEIIVHESSEGPGTQIGLKCHGNLRFEQLRCVSMVVAIENSNFVTPSWSTFLFSLLRRSPNVDHLDIKFFKNEFRAKVEEALSTVGEGSHGDGEEERFTFILKHYAQPEWLEEIARQPSLREVSFEGNVPTVWLDRLRRESEGRIQVFSDGVRFRETENRDALDADDDKVKAPALSTEDVQDVEFQIIIEPAARFD